MIRGRPFPKGISGNPSGRPKADSQLKELAEEYTVEALEGILAIARDVKASAATRLQAWSEILDRGHGRPAQAVSVADEVALPIPLMILDTEMCAPGMPEKLMAEQREWMRNREAHGR